jgi:energy-coupling factor transporter ATP-binding protein EcfA2
MFSAFCFYSAALLLIAPMRFWQEVFSWLGEYLATGTVQPATKLQQPSQPQSQPVSINRVDIKEVNSKVHSLILGETGSGKSTLATYLAKQLKGEVVVIDPHFAPGDWEGLRVIGKGRNYQAIANYMQSALDEMDGRYKLREQGKSNFNELVIICDEYPAIAASDEAGKISKVWLKKLAREARKVKIKLLILTQGSEVKSLGLEGEGSVRASFCFVRLGELAVAHAKSLKDEQLLAEVKKLKRPCMVDDAVAVLPTIN